MKIQNLFDLLEASQDLLSHFDKVSSPEQLVSRLAILKRQDPEDMLYDVLALRAAVDSALGANIELDGTLSSDEESPDDTNMDNLLANFADKPETSDESDETIDQPTTTTSPEKESTSI